MVFADTLLTEQNLIIIAVVLVIICLLVWLFGRR